MFKEDTISNIKRILYYHYKNDIYFPKSCDSVSKTIAYALSKDKDICDNYIVKIKRGHFFNENETEDCYCINFNEDEVNNLNSNCSECSCDYMITHSWLELTSKKDNKRTIVDFTSIQFNEYSNLGENVTEEEIYNFLKSNSEFLITEDNHLFNNYKNDIYSLDMEYISEKINNQKINGEKTYLLDVILNTIK